MTERVVRHADVAVPTTRATEEVGGAGEYHDLLIPTDGSEYAAVAVEHGLGIA